jgi:uncharacterized protein with ParB-like and HNH nuclease domain
MQEPSALTQNLKTLLKDQHYIVNYYQREYRWGLKQIEQLLSDLMDSFTGDYKPGQSIEDVQNYSYYFMGSIIVHDGNTRSIIDGQQRLTSLTLLIIHLIHLQKEYNIKSPSLDNMVYSDNFGKKSFNIFVEERSTAMNAIYNNENLKFELTNESEKNLVERFNNIKEIFSFEDTNRLSNFIYWLIEKVVFVIIKTNSEQDSHKIFVTMNDRGLSLNSAEMLKGYILSNIQLNEARELADKEWKLNVSNLKNGLSRLLNESSDDHDLDFFRTWLRSKYAKSIRETKIGSKDVDYELLGSEFHEWIRNNHESIGIIKSNNYLEFATTYLKFYINIYLKLIEYSVSYNKEFKHVYYNHGKQLNYQYMLILSAIKIDDNFEIIDRKIKLISAFIDIYSTIRIFNYKKISFNNNKYFIFKLMNDIRDKDLKEISTILFGNLVNMKEKIEEVKNFKLNNYTAKYMLGILARMTSFINEQVNINDNYTDYVNRKNKNAYDIEHILPNDFESYKDKFTDQEDFLNNRSLFGNLILLKSDKNRSYQDMNYNEKKTYYLGDNILAQSLNSNFYKSNPNFLKLSYAFKPYDYFDKSSIKERIELYYKLSKDIYNFDLIKEYSGNFDEESYKKNEIQPIAKISLSDFLSDKKQRSIKMYEYIDSLINSKFSKLYKTVTTNYIGYGRNDKRYYFLEIHFNKGGLKLCMRNPNREITAGEMTPEQWGYSLPYIVHYRDDNELENIIKLIEESYNN